jgi:hypothetical protein
MKHIENKVSRKPNDDEKAMPIVTQEDIHICSDKEYSFQRGSGTAESQRPLKLKQRSNPG